MRYTARALTHSDWVLWMWFQGKAHFSSSPARPEAVPPCLKISSIFVPTLVNVLKNVRIDMLSEAANFNQLFRLHVAKVADYPAFFNLRVDKRN